MNGDSDPRAERGEEPEEGDEPIVAFFHALPPTARRDYEELATRDRRYGEDITAEARS